MLARVEIDNEAKKKTDVECDVNKRGARFNRRIKPSATADSNSMSPAANYAYGPYDSSNECYYRTRVHTPPKLPVEYSTTLAERKFQWRQRLSASDYRTAGCKLNYGEAIPTDILGVGPL